MAGHACASNGCRNLSKRRCGTCKTSYYCSKTCQKAHWKKHKSTCKEPDAFLPLRPGIFDFMRLPREVRDKIYAEVVTAKFSPSEQDEYDELLALEDQPDRCNRRRNRLDLLDRHLMVAHGVDPSDICNVPFHGFEPLYHVRGLLFANKQISQELMETLSSKNTTFILVQEDHTLNKPGQPYHDFTAQVTQRAKKLYINVITTEDHPGEDKFQACVGTVKRQLNDIVTSLNRVGGRLDSLTVRYTSCFPGEIEDLRVDADGLATHREARVIWVMDPRTDKMRSLNHADMKQLYLHSTTIADALCALDIPVSEFRIFGDLAGPDLARVCRKFGIPAPEVTQEKLDRYGQRLNKRAEHFRQMANNNPGLAETLMGQVRMHEQIFSTRALAIRKVALYGPPDGDPEYERQMALARSI